MKKETINTFKDGMVKDLHPLTTPPSVLTDALNATLVTYNGNEMILQNDMGNTQVGTAFLPAGYVPVGMKEHGGIIYVAAYNPETKKGQIGSFPSPKQLWEGEGWSVNSSSTAIAEVSLNTSSFYGNDSAACDSSLYIKNEIVKLGLFKFNDGTERIFHPGDKYALAIPNSNNYNTIKSYVDDGKIILQLGVIKKDGTIEVMADAKEDWFLFSGDAQSFITSNKPRVFNASSSGSLILIVNIVTLDSFNLLREYSLQNDQQTVDVTFTGEGTRDQEIIKTSAGGPLYLYNAKSCSANNGQIVLSGSTGTTNFNIYPHLDYGIIKRMGRSGSINFDRIKKTQGDFHEWRFFVNNSYIKIGWAYEFYNLGNKKELAGIQMDFYDLVKPSTYPDSPEDTIVLQKDSYSGNFEDYIRFDQHPNIKRKHIYVVRISRLLATGQLDTPYIAFKLLYVSQYYNQYYNQVYIGDDNKEIDLDFSKCVEFKSPSFTDPAYINFSSKFTCNPQGSTLLNITKPNSSGTKETINTTVLASNANMFTADLNNASENQYEFVAELVNNYNNKLELFSEYSNLNDEVIGIPNPTVLTTVLNNFTVGLTPQANVDWRTSAINDSIFDTIENMHTAPIISSNPTTTTQNGSKIIEFAMNDYRYAQGKSSGLKTDPYEVTDYAPFYDPDSTDRADVFYSYDVQNPTLLSGSKSRGVRYGSTLSANEDVIEGAETGANNGDVGLDAANKAINTLRPPTVNMMCGIGARADLAFQRLQNLNLVIKRDNAGTGNWPRAEKENEVDKDADYIVAVWKFTDGVSRLVDLFSRRSWEASSSINWPRLDVMLRCFMSQIFIAKRLTKTTSYITTNSSNYRYQEGNTDINITLTATQNSTTQFEDIMLVYEDGLESGYEGKTLTQMLAIWNDKEDISDNPITNIIPKINAELRDTTDLESVQIPEDFGMDTILKYFLTSSRDVSLLESNVDPRIIKIVDVTKNSQNAEACYDSDNGKPKTLEDGSFKWVGTPALIDVGDSKTSGETMYSWNGGTWKMRIGLKRMFKTRAEVMGWHTLPQGEYNEILGNLTASRRKDCPYIQTTNTGCDWISKGTWVEDNDEGAPDMYFNVLLSDKSFFKLAVDIA